MTDMIMLALRIIDKILDFINIKRKKYIYIKEEDLKIDCFDFIEQIVKKNDDISPYKVNIDYEIDSSDYLASTLLEARCNIDSYSAYEFTIVSTTLRKYEETECMGYDLTMNSDVGIRPKLISPDSFAKKLSLQLNKGLNKGELLKIRYSYKSYGTMEGSKRYLINGGNYRRLLLNEYIISIHFLEDIPENIRVYEIDSKRRTYRFQYKIFPDRINNLFIDSCDVQKIKSHKKIVYVFD